MVSHGPDALLPHVRTPTPCVPCSCTATAQVCSMARVAPAACTMTHLWPFLWRVIADAPPGAHGFGEGHPQSAGVAGEWVARLERLRAAAERPTHAVAGTQVRDTHGPGLSWMRRCACTAFVKAPPRWALTAPPSRRGWVATRGMRGSCWWLRMTATPREASCGNAGRRSRLPGTCGRQWASTRQGLTTYPGASPGST